MCRTVSVVRIVLASVLAVGFLISGVLVWIFVYGPVYRVHESYDGSASCHTIATCSVQVFSRGRMDHCNVTECGWLGTIGTTQECAAKSGDCSSVQKDRPPNPVGLFMLFFGNLVLGILAIVWVTIEATLCCGAPKNTCLPWTRVG